MQTLPELAQPARLLQRQGWAGVSTPACPSLPSARLGAASQPRQQQARLPLPALEATASGRSSEPPSTSLDRTGALGNLT